MRKRWIVLTVVILLCVCGIALAQLANSNYREAGGLRWVIGGSIDVESGGEMDFESGSELKLGSLVTMAPTAVALTSPTVTFSVLNMREVSLTSDANQTGLLVTGGVINQVVTIISGAGSNTMQFDDATSMVIGANITLTEAQQDALTLQCIDAGGTAWRALSAHDN